MFPIVINRNLNKDNPFGIFDKIYCINLDKRKDRWEQSELEFKKHGLNVERFSAIDGNCITLRSRNSFRLNKGEQGCILSHINILKSMVEQGLEKILILEDDVSFVDNLNNLLDCYIKQVPPNWDMLYLGGNHIKQPIKISENIGKLIKTYTTSYYAITNSMARFLISQIKHDSAIDVFYSSFHPDFNCYVLMPHLAWQRPNYSDIHNKHVDYKKYL